MNDRELLELAAKAAGLSGFWVDAGLNVGTNESPIIWNPITDDGDVQRLSVKLAFCVSHWPRQSPPDVMVGYSTGPNSGANWIEEYGDDPLAATRRAIVCAAAEIGKAMP